MADLVVDSREQRPLFATARRHALPTGDYSLWGYEDRVAVERKSVHDLMSSCAGGGRRFLRQIRRLSLLPYRALLVVGVPEQMVQHEKMLRAQWENKRGVPYRGVTADLVGSCLDSWCGQEYCVYVKWCNDERAARRWLKKWLTMAKRKIEGGATRHDDPICRCGGGERIGHDGRCKK